MQTRNEAAARKLAKRLAAVANPTANASPNEASTAFAKLVQLCFAHGFAVADFADAATIAAHNPTPQAEAPHEKPHAAADGARAKRRALVAEIVASIRVVYAGASPSYRRSGKAHTFATYADTCATPRQSIGPNGPSERDESALLGLIERADASGAFDPVALCVDLGAFSRLASVDFIARAGEAFTLTDAGLSRARGVVSRAR
jgi:hypothetical protein